MHLRSRSDRANSSIETRLHVKIYDADEQVYQVQESLFPRPSSDDVAEEQSELAFQWTENPFSFKVVRKCTNETLFDTSAASLVIEDQYLRVRTSLPNSPHLYGLGEHTDPFQLNTTNYTRTVSLLTRLPQHHVNICSCGIAMLTEFPLVATCMDTTQFTSTIAAPLSLTASSF